METMEVINELANLVIFVNATLFYIFIFGRNVKAIDNLPKYMQILLRLGLAIPSIGGLWNVLVIQYPPYPEIFVNIGYACLWTWASIFHYTTFVRR